MRQYEAYCVCHRELLSTAYACHTKRGYALHNGTTVVLIAHGCELLRNVADGCGRESSVEWRCPNPLNPRVQGQPSLRIWKRLLQYLNVFNNVQLYFLVCLTGCSPGILNIVA